MSSGGRRGSLWRRATGPSREGAEARFRRELCGVPAEVSVRTGGTTGACGVFGGRFRGLRAGLPAGDNGRGVSERGAGSGLRGDLECLGGVLGGGRWTGCRCVRGRSPAGSVLGDERGLRESRKDCALLGLLPLWYRRGGEKRKVCVLLCNVIRHFRTLEGRAFFSGFQRRRADSPEKYGKRGVSGLLSDYDAGPGPLMFRLQKFLRDNGPCRMNTCSHAIPAMRP